MKAWKWLGIGIFVSLSLVVFGLTVGWFLWGHVLWPMPVMAMSRNSNIPQTYFACDGTSYGMGYGPMMYGDWQDTPCDDDDYVGSGMMGNDYAPGLCFEETENVTCPALGSDDSESATGEMLTLEDAHGIIEQYLTDTGYTDLEIAEVMEFKYNFYAIVREAATGIGAMELLADKWSGVVVPEMGPNMMWNAKYGMHRRGRMMDWGDTEENNLTAEEALDTAQTWLDENYPGVIVEDHADVFYGYYTIHTLQNDEIAGMLSVHGDTGQVWYHTWHGAFIQMMETEREH